MKYDIQFTNQFKNDLKLAKKQNTETMILQATIRGTRECHIEQD